MREQQPPEQSSTGMGTAKTPDTGSVKFSRTRGKEPILPIGSMGDQMKKVVITREPSLLNCLQEWLVQGATCRNCMASNVISNSKNPEVKADLVRIYVNQSIAEGDRHQAVDMLDYGKAAELDLPEYNEKFVYEQYKRSIEEGNPTDAYLIARRMVLGRAKILPKTAYNSFNLQDEWVINQHEALRLVAEEVLNRIKRDPASPIDCHNDKNLYMVFSSLIGDVSGRKVKRDPKDANLIDRVAKATIDRDIVRKRPDLAVVHATIAEMPEEYMKGLKRIVDPNVVQRLQDFGQRLAVNIGRLTGKKS